MAMVVSQLAKTFSSSKVQYLPEIAVLLASAFGVYYWRYSLSPESTSAEKNNRSGSIWGDSGFDLLANEESMESPIAQNRKLINNMHHFVKRVFPRRMHNWILPPLLYFAVKGNTSSSPRVQFLAEVVAYGVTVYNLYYPGDEEIEGSQEKPNSDQGDAPLHSDSIYTAASKVGPAVVHICLPNEIGNNVEENVGSGIIFDKEGLILTCAHGVANKRKKKVFVNLLDQGTFEGTVISVGKASDIAFVKINPYFPLPTAKFHSTCTLHAGDSVVAIGSPEPFQINFTTHTVSKCTENGRKYLQMNGSTSVGNSGGPVLDMNGKIVGINILKVSGDRRISFILPIDRVCESMRKFHDGWKTQRNWFGFQVANLSEVNISQIKDRHLEFPDVEGVIIAEVKRGSPAHNAGFTPGDVIVEFGGKGISRAREIINMMTKKKKATPIQVIVLVRRGADAPFRLTLTSPE